MRGHSHAAGTLASACQNARVSAPAVEPGPLAEWCTKHLGSPPADDLFKFRHLSTVTGTRLADGREVVVKVRPDSPRLAGCVEVQQRMFDAGFPCPEPLTGVLAFGEDVATAESYVPGGALLPCAEHAARLFAEAFARLVGLAPGPAQVVAALDPAPSWASWDHAEGGLWPCPEGSDIDLGEVGGPRWIDDAGRRARDRLRAGQTESIIGHCDWLAGNLRWNGDALLVVHDWDSIIVESEAVLVGFAAALFSTRDADELATVEETQQFLAAYCSARGREFSDDEIERSWAAGVWTRAYDAKCQNAMRQPITSLSEDEAFERVRRSGAGI